MFTDDTTNGKDIDFKAPSAPVGTEIENTAQKEIWMIEDNAANGAAYMRSASMFLSQNSPDAKMVHFQEGETAVEKFRQLVEDGGALPVIILMDYRLDEDVENPKYTNGVEVINELKAIATAKDVQLPEIVAFSSEEAYTQELLQAGATSSVNKRKDAFNYFKSLKV